jgi:hypothetical protein
MLPQSPSAPQPPRVRIGVSLDTSRHGHVAVFLTDDLQPAADPLPFAESAAGYAAFRHRLERIALRHVGVLFLVRLDTAGQYADNLRHFLRQLAGPFAQKSFSLLNATFAISCGDPQRNKNYRAALFGSKKSDAVEAHAAARFAPA